MPFSSREIRLAARPVGEPPPSDFALVETEVADPADGFVVVRNTLMSVDPYMRGRMNARRSYAPPYELGAPLHGGAVGEVVASRAEGVSVGDTVVHQLGWREYATLSADHARVVDTSLAPASANLGVLGGTGFTAYVGLLEIAALREGDVVFVSAAAGAVGSMVGQIAKLRGHTVIGSAGSAAKVRVLLDELGFDAAFDYHDGPVYEQLKAAAPDGIDVYFDNVGGEHLEAALSCMRQYGRVAVCGMISTYNATEPVPGPRNLNLLIERRLTMRGFLVFDHPELHPAFAAEVGGYLREGKLVDRQTLVKGGVPAAPQALIDLLRGANTGKMLVEL